MKQRDKRNKQTSLRHTMAICAVLIWLVPANAQTTPATSKPTAAQSGVAPTLFEQRLAKAVADIDAKRKALHVPGVSLVIVKDDKVVAIQGLGFRDLDENLPVTPETLFAIGSSTKAFTAMTVLMSEEDGKLKLTDSPRKYLPYFKMRDPDIDSKITISDLLCHRSGLERTDMAWYTGKLNRQEIIRVACEAKPTAKLGEKFQYQNIMFLTAGEVVAAAQKRRWEDYLYWRILRPLGMKSTTLSVEDVQERNDFSRGYSYSAEKQQTRQLPIRDIRMVAPAGAINSSAQDMAQWLRLMLNGGVFNGKRLISQARFDQLVSKHMSVAGPIDYGYGWFLRDWHGHKVVEHGGNIDGFSAEVALMPDQKLGFALLTNQNNSPLQSQSLDIIWSALVDVPATPSTTPVTPVTSGPATDPQKEVGVYPLAPGLDIAISYSNGKLYALPTNQPKLELTSLGGRKYTIGPPAPPGIFLTFRPSKDDPNRTELQFEQGGAKIVVLAKPTTPFTAPLSVEELFQKAIAAAGGEANQRKPKSLKAEFVLEMPTQGIKGEGVEYRQAPYNIALDATLRAAGKTIGRAHSYFDGKQGGEEISFGNSETVPPSQIPAKRIEADFYPLLNWKTNFKSVTIKGLERLGDEEVYVVEEATEKDEPIIERYSTKSFLLLQRNRKTLSQELGISIETVEKFSDYRLVNGVMFPFKRIQTEMGANETHLEYKKVEFDARIAPTTFRPHKK